MIIIKIVITYGTFDLFHKGHYNLLKKAKALGDYLIVGVTSDYYDKTRGKLNVKDDLLKRIENVKNTGFANKIIVEEYEGQKYLDICKYRVDVFAIGSDWKGKFNYLNNYCKVVYIDRTKGISSTQLRNKNIINLGVVGNGRIAKRFLIESRFVSGIQINGVFGRNKIKLSKFIVENDLSFYCLDYNTFLNKVDAVYIATPHLTHYDYIKKALINKKHVLCEKPLVLSVSEAKELYLLAKKNNVVLMEAIKTAYCPGFLKLVNLVKSGIIGDIKNIDCTFTKLVNGNLRELDLNQSGGSVTELASYVLLVAIKIFGKNIKNIQFITYKPTNSVDLFTKINIIYSKSVFTGKVGLGVKSEGDLIISGTKGYIYVNSPWWKTELCDVRYENRNNNKKYLFEFKGDGLRYELSEFVDLINNKQINNYKLSNDESMAIINVIEKFLKFDNVIKI